jgi:MFS family permease
MPSIPSIILSGNLAQPLPIAIGKPPKSPIQIQELELQMTSEKRKEAWDEAYPASLIQEPYNIFTRRKRWMLFALVGAAGVFPTLTLGMYLPVLDTTAKDLNVSLSAVTPTISVYLIIQGVALLYWGSLSESIGRRQTLLYIFLIYALASLILCFSPNLAVLAVFQGVQGFAIASTVSISTAVVRDISEASERDSFLSYLQCCRDATLLLAPTLGGLLSKNLGFRAIFVFQSSIAIALLLIIVFFLPETLRIIAGNGSVRLTGAYKPLAVRFKFMHEQEQTRTAVLYAPQKLSLRVLVKPLRLLREKDILLSLISGGLVFAIWMMVTVSTTGLFEEAFRLNTILLGLAFVPNAIGSIAGSALMGKFLHNDLITALSRYNAERSLASSTVVPNSSLPADFSVEHLRLRYLPFLILILVITLSGYGFTLAYPSATSRPGWILLPLTLQFIIAATANAVCAIQQTLVADIWHQTDHASKAATSLMRCLFAAVSVGIVQKLLDALGVWSTFVALGLMIMVLISLPVMQWYWGKSWRAEREARNLATKELQPAG